MPMKRPFVVLYVTASIDGRIAPCPDVTLSNMEKYHLGNYPGYELLFGGWDPFCNSIKELHNPDAYMEGSNMIMYEGQEVKTLTGFTGDTAALYVDFLPDEVVHRSGRNTWLIIVDGQGRLRDGYKGEPPESHILHLTSNSAPPEYLAFLRREHIPYLISGEKRVDLKGMMKKMHKILAIKTIATSSAGKLGGALIRQDLIDEINILFNPFIIGGTRTPNLFRSTENDPPDIMPARLELISKEFYANGSFWIRYKVLR